MMWDAEKGRVDTCVYCGIRPAVKMEHVVAQVFFNHPLPKQMITVLSCHECDSGTGDGGDCPFHQDEDYMAKLIAARGGMTEHSVVKRKVEDGKVNRALPRPTTSKHWIAA